MTVLESVNEYVRDTVIPEIERTHDVEVLLAVESGSRMWGFESPDSDYDIRFIYRHRDPRSEFNVVKVPDHLSYINEALTIDASGWNVTKSLRLMYEGNGSLIDWFGSGIVYKKLEVPVALMTLLQRSIIGYEYARLKFLYHHRSLLRKAWAEITETKQEGGAKTKKVLYAARSAAIYEWGRPRIAGYNAWYQIPVTMRDLLGVMPHNVAQELVRVIDLKRVGFEKNSRIALEDYPHLTEFLKRNVYTEMDFSPDPVRPSVEESNAVLRALIMG